MAISLTKRPRNVGPYQAAAILYGDWGTSKAYVIGIALALASQNAFWIILAVCVLMALVAINYINICRNSPFGGGVYASARRKSEILSLLGAFFLIADYIITAALSAVACFSYLGFPYPEIWSIVAILLIGVLNYWGPKHSGNLALIIGLATFLVVVVISLFALPYFDHAIHALHRPEGHFITYWDQFVVAIIAMSGIESVANITGVMRLDPGSSDEKPSVVRTSRKAILLVMFEVCIFTAFLGLMAQTLPGISVQNGQVFDPQHHDIRDSMLKYIGYYFSSLSFGADFANTFSFIIGLSFAILLLSAVNTAIIALSSLVFVMSKDGEVPESFQKINSYGTPYYALLLATITPCLVLLFVSDLIELANLYAVGFVGAIATNLGVNAFDYKISMGRFSRLLMMFTFVIMTCIEISLFVDKPQARIFALSILTGGIILRGFILEQRQKQWTAKKVRLKHASLFADDTKVVLHYGAFLCAVRSIGKTLNYALEEAKTYEQPLYILFVREQKVITEEDRTRTWLEDETACQIFDYAKESSHEMIIKFLYAVSDSPADTIVDFATKLKVSRVIMGRPRQSQMVQMLRGNVIREIAEVIPNTIDLVVIS